MQIHSRYGPTTLLLCAEASPADVDVRGPYAALAGAIKQLSGCSVVVQPSQRVLAAPQVATSHLIAVPFVLGAYHPSLPAARAAAQAIQARQQALRVSLAAPILTLDQIVAYLARCAATIVGSEAATLLVVAGGSHEPLANAEVAQIARLLWEHRGVGAVEYAFLQHTEPTVEVAVGRAFRAGAKRVVVLPLTLLADAQYTAIAHRAAALMNEARPVAVAPPLLDVRTAAMIACQRAAEVLTDGTHGLLPPRYHGSQVSAAPMAAAPLRYDAAGQVAWDEIWTDFCDLALAGGPPHRGTLLEPVDPQLIQQEPAAYEQVLAELERGLRMVSALPLEMAVPGWIGLRCDDEAMALWMLRAIVVENVTVRREASVLLLPVGPHFRLEYEIKNIVTVVAKTLHYWREHRDQLG